MSFKQMLDGSLVDIAAANEQIISEAPKHAKALKDMGRFQVGMPTRVRMQLAACGVTIDVLHNHLMIARSAVKSFMTVIGLESIKGLPEAEAIDKVAQMIMLSHECKLKLIELAKSVKAANGKYSTQSEDARVLIAADELFKILPPEITEELNNVNDAGKSA